MNNSCAEAGTTALSQRHRSQLPAWKDDSAYRELAAQKARLTVSFQRMMRAGVESGECVVGQQIVTGIFGYHAQVGLPDEPL
jgi:hypothetical protein